MGHHGRAKPQVMGFGSMTRAAGAPERICWEAGLQGLLAKMQEENHLGFFNSTCFGTTAVEGRSFHFRCVLGPSINFRPFTTTSPFLILLLRSTACPNR